MKVKTIWGIAGAGKTSFLAKLLTGKYDPSFDFSPKNTLLVTFSRMATQVLQEKIAQLTDKKEKLFTVSTFHSYIAQQAVKQKIHYATLSIKEISSFFVNEGFPPIRAKQIMNVIDLFTFGHIYDCINKTRALMLTPEEYYDKFQYIDEPLWGLSKEEYVRIFKKFKEFLQDMQAYDYAETLVLGFKIIPPELQFIVIDEANDLCPIMWALIKKWDPKICLLVGDPNQNIYDFAGSTEVYLASVPPTIFLDTSQRCAKQIGEFALKFMEYGKSFKTVKEGGLVAEITEADLLDVIKKHQGEHILILPYKIRTVEDLSTKLMENNIPHRVFGILPFPAKINYFLELITEYKVDFENMRMKSLKFLEYLPSELFARRKTKILNAIKSLPEAKVKHFPEIKRLLDKLMLFPLTKLFELARPTREEFETWEKIKYNFVSWHKTKVEIMNAHKAKGYEADVVIFYYDIPKRFFTSGDKGALRRLIYTAITRAKKAFYYIPVTADFTTLAS